MKILNCLNFLTSCIAAVLENWQDLQKFKHHHRKEHVKLPIGNTQNSKIMSNTC